MIQNNDKMKSRKMGLSRRDALKSLSLLGSGIIVTPGLAVYASRPNQKKSISKRPGILAIGVNSRGMRVALNACNYGKMVACCDADTATFGKFQAELRAYQSEDPVYYTDYIDALERDDVDMVTIGTPDHWHALMITDALKAGKDVYAEKPMTLTITEGIAVCNAVRKSDRIVQVGTQQRSEYDGVFLKAVAIAKEGILGNRLKATAYVPKKRTVKEVYPVTNPPASLNWDRWCGPVQELRYCPQRCHKDWRGFVETGHGAITDWGAHHLDIANWALGVDNTGPVEISGEGIFPYGKDATYAVITGEKPSSSLPNSFSIVRDYQAEMIFGNGNSIIITDKPLPAAFADHSNGLLIEGEHGSIFMSRQTTGFDFQGSLGENIKNDKPLQQRIIDRVMKLYKGKTPAFLVEEMTGERVVSPHMKNFFDCMEDGNEPISDVFSAHRANSSALLAHASILLGRTLKWNADNQEFWNDNEANRLLARPYREPYSL